VLPDVVAFKLLRPPVCRTLSDRELRAEILARLDACELELIGERQDRGIEALGVARVLAQPWYGFPGRLEDLFGTSPEVSGKSKWARIEALQRRAEFVLAHGVARARLLAGERDVVWPFGTWIRVRLGLPRENASP